MDDDFGCIRDSCSKGYGLIFCSEKIFFFVVFLDLVFANARWTSDNDYNAHKPILLFFKKEYMENK